ncbi:hypothetical protein GEMRC1_013254 [Eukaryota sp. GEM-RC1]
MNNPRRPVSTVSQRRAALRAADRRPSSSPRSRSSMSSPSTVDRIVSSSSSPRSPITRSDVLPRLEVLRNTTSAMLNSNRSRSSSSQPSPHGTSPLKVQPTKNLTEHYNVLCSDTNEMNNYKCSICLDILQNPVEFKCCHNVSCKTCAITKTCPFCRHSPPKIVENIPVQRMLNSLRVKCNHCPYETTIGEYPTHYNSCPGLLKKCVVCNSSFRTSDFLQHVINQHEAAVISCFSV